MTDREIDASIGMALFGWRWYAMIRDDKEAYRRFIATPLLVKRNFSDSAWEMKIVKESDGREFLFPDWDHDLPYFSTDANACRQVEDEIELRRLVDDYCWEIEQICKVSKSSWGVTWDLLHFVTPRQRCLAALEAVKGDKP